MKKTCLVAWISLVSIAALAQTKSAAQPIGIFDSGTGGLTVLEAILSLDQFNNQTGKPGADGKLICFLHPKTTNAVLVELCQAI